MKAAFFSDIHANLPALETALGRARGLGAEALFCAGDMVGFGPHPSEVVGLLRENGVTAIGGNVERKVLRAADHAAPPVRAEGRAAAPVWTANSLDPEALRWLRDLPPRRRMTVGGADVLMVHGSPLSDVDYIYPSLTGRALAAKVGGERPDVLVCGHSHVPFVRRVSGVLVVNCGSVGRPVDGDPRGAFALADLSPGGASRARIIRFSYDVASLLRDVAGRGSPGVRPEEFVSGRKVKGE